MYCTFSADWFPFGQKCYGSGNSQGTQDAPSSSTTPGISTIDKKAHRRGHHTAPDNTSQRYQPSHSFLITITPQHPIIHGALWLSTHDPLFSWGNQDILKWSDHCHAHCVLSTQVDLAPSIIESPEEEMREQISPEYEYLNVLIFCRRSVRAMNPWMCSIGAKTHGYHCTAHSTVRLISCHVLIDRVY